MLKKLIFGRDRETILNKIIYSSDRGYVCLVNANALVHYYKSESYRNILNNSFLNICDGISVKIINNIVNINKVNQTFPGPDLFIQLINLKHKSHFFIGCEDLNSMHKLVNNFKNKTLIDYYVPKIGSVESFNYDLISQKINDTKPDFIWVGLGAPKQEIFMSKLEPFIKKGLMIGVGAAFNFYNGTIGRSPNFFIKLKLEWIYRIYKEPSKMFPRFLKNLFYLPLITFNEFFRKK